MWMLLLACAPLQGRVEALEAQNEALEAQVAALEARLAELEGKVTTREEERLQREERYRERAAARSETATPVTPSCTELDDGNYTLLPGQDLRKLDLAALPLRAIPHRGADGEVDGFRVSGIRRGSEADSCGFRNGDVIHAVNGHPLTSLEQVTQAHQALLDSDGYTITATRRGQPLSWQVRAAE